MSEVNWATVKYRANDTLEDVPISKIFEEFNDKGNKRKRPFLPKHKTDFTPGKLYVVYSSKDLPPGDEASFYALIGRLADCKENLHQETATSGRQLRDIRWGVMRGGLSEPQTSETEEDDLREDVAFPERNAVFLERRRKKLVQENRRQVNMKDLDVYLNMNPVQTKETQEKDSEAVMDLTEQIKVLQQQLQEEREKSERLREEKERSAQSTPTGDLASLKSFFSEEINKLKTDMATEIQAFKEETTKTVSSLRSDIEATQGLIRKCPGERLQSVQNWVNNIPEAVEDWVNDIPN